MREEPQGGLPARTVEIADAFEQAAFAVRPPGEQGPRGGGDFLIRKSDIVANRGDGVFDGEVLLPGRLALLRVPDLERGRFERRRRAAG